MIYSNVRRWLLEHTPYEPSLLEGAGFEAVLAQRIASVGGGSESAYLAALDGSPDELDRLSAGIAVPETWLFRYPRSYDLLVDVLRRRLAAGGSTLRMLSIGCATGQEPYCMAMAALHAGWPAERVAVLGLDRSREFLRIAAAGEYTASSIRGEIPAWGAALLRHHGEQIGIDPAVRAVVRFARADATSPTFLSDEPPYDVVFCRNVLIYLNAPARARLLDSLASALAPAGLLFVGHAEHVLRGMASLRPVAWPHAFALERVQAQATADPPPRTASPASPAPTVAPRSSPARPAPPATPLPAAPPPPEETLEDARDLADTGRLEDAEAMVRSILARHGPSAPAFELLGMTRMAANDTPGAKRMFERAVYLEPARAASLLQLAIITERTGNPARAATFWERARRASTTVPQERHA